MRDKVLEYFGTVITDSWEEDCDFYIYEASTADGYGITVATKNPTNININEHVFYYEDSDLAETLANVFKFEKCDKIHIENPEAEWLDGVFEELSDWIDVNEEE
jgi:hypothetical protein